MTTSPTTSLSKPSGDDKVPLGSFVYLRARNKRRAYDLVIKEFKRSGLSQADLARRLGKGTDRVCKLLGGPGNWTLDTVSDLLFAISAAEPKYELSYPLDKAPRNYIKANWLNTDAALIRAASTVPQANTAPPITAFLASGPKTQPTPSQESKSLESQLKPRVAA